MSPERRRRIVTLLGLLTEGLPTGARRPLAASGFVNGIAYRVVDCPDCLTNGRRMPGCETCGGRGVIRDPEAKSGRDPYDGGFRLGVFGESQRVHEQRRERERAIARLEQQTAPPISERDVLAATRPDGWELERRRLYAAFDLAALEQALDVVRVRDIDAYRALHAAIVYGWQEETGGTAARCERGLELLGLLLPERLRAPSEKPPRVAAKLPLPERNKRIRTEARDGAPAQWLAHQYGLSVRQVNRVIAGQEAA